MTFAVESGILATCWGEGRFEPNRKLPGNQLTTSYAGPELN